MLNLIVRSRSNGLLLALNYLQLPTYAYYILKNAKFRSDKLDTKNTKP